MTRDLEFFFDPVCPWAWITSRWVVEVQSQRQYAVGWRFISLWIINEDLQADWYTPAYRAGHLAGHQVLRVADAVRLGVGAGVSEGSAVEVDVDAAVGALYSAVGTAFHVEGRRDEMIADPVPFMREMLGAAGLDLTFADDALDESHDPYLRAETEAAFARTGRDVGTPIITFHPGTDREGSFFGPVINRIPRGDEAARLWDAIEIVATTSGVSELKRSARGRPDFS